MIKLFKKSKFTKGQGRDDSTRNNVHIQSAIGVIYTLKMLRYAELTIALKRTDFEDVDCD